MRDYKWVIITFMALAAMLVATPTSMALRDEGVIITPDAMFSSYVYQGLTNSHYYYVDPQNSYINVVLYWGNTQNELKLMIKRPDGSSFGTFYDWGDGILDGRIGLRINNPQSGTWVFMVNGYKVSPPGQGYNLYVG